MAFSERSEQSYAVVKGAVAVYSLPCTDFFISKRAVLVVDS